MAPYIVTVHALDSPHKLCAYEHGDGSNRLAVDAVVFIGGLGDGPHSIPYVGTLAGHLKSQSSSYSIFELRLRSSFTAFGYSSLDEDVADMAVLIRYLREDLGRKKVVIVGHSTGCQVSWEITRALSIVKDRKPPVSDPYPVMNGRG
jgi:pimeloyl-ACP methyl ester carboxylesterase